MCFVFICEVVGGVVGSFWVGFGGCGGVLILGSGCCVVFVGMDVCVGFVVVWVNIEVVGGKG